MHKYSSVLAACALAAVSCGGPDDHATTAASGSAQNALAASAALPDFTCTSAAGQFWPVEVSYTSADNQLFVKVSKPATGVYRLPYPGYLAVDSITTSALGFVLTATRPTADKVVVEANKVSSAYGPYTVIAHLDLKINVYQRFIHDVDVSNCAGYPQR